MIPVGIVIPTRNAAQILRGRTAELRALLEPAAEAVVVDSSEDDTLDLLKRELSGLPVRFFQHPPGLYPSWNYGIAQVRAPYLYVATAGDAVRREGLTHLLETAERLRADIVVSPPEFVDEHGKKLPDKRWPIHGLLERRPIHEPLVLEPWEVFLLETAEAPKALIGSSAANLYRTEVLQKFPFPSDYGHFGDVAWGIEHAFSTRLAVTPAVISQFVVHQSGSALPIDRIEQARARLLALAMEILDRQLATAGPEAPPWSPLLKRLSTERMEAWRLRRGFDALRRSAFPWFLRPAAWQARSARKQQNRTVAALESELLSAGSSGPQFRTAGQACHA